MDNPVLVKKKSGESGVYSKTRFFKDVNGLVGTLECKLM
jgi:hypothetical protein